MEDKLKMICEISLCKAVDVASEMSRLDTGTCSFSRACDDLKDLVKTVKETKEIMHSYLK